MRSLCRWGLVLGSWALLTMPLSSPAVSDDAAKPAAMTAEQKEAFETLLRDYILEHPEILIESLTTYQAKQKVEEDQQAKEAIVSLREDLVNDSTSPVVGKGDVAIVEFFDYRCGYCKRVFPAIQELLESDDGIRYVFKEFPVLGPDSVTAAKVSLAVWNLAPEKYMQFHGNLMQARGTLTEDRIIATAVDLGIDAGKIRATMAEPHIQETLDRNFALARQLGINGTPSFIIGDTLVPGAVDLATLKRMVEEARSS